MKGEKEFADIRFLDISFLHTHISVYDRYKFRHFTIIFCLLLTKKVKILYQRYSL